MRSLQCLTAFAAALVCCSGCGVPAKVVEYVLADVGESYGAGEVPKALLDLQQEPLPALPSEPAKSAGYSPPPLSPLAQSPDYEDSKRAFSGGNFNLWEAVANEVLFDYGYYGSSYSQAADFIASFETQARAQERQKRDAFLQKMYEWRRLFPESRAQRICLVEALLVRAWLERGTGYADTVTEEGWRGFSQYTKLAEDAALDARAAGIEHPQLYASLITLGMVRGYPDKTMKALFAQGLALDPLYDSLYSSMANAYEEKWGGSPQQWPEISQLAVNATWTRTGQAARLRFFRALDHCGAELFDLPAVFKWEELKPAYEDYMTFFPESCYLTNVVTQAACAFRDRDFARAKLLEGCAPDKGVWTEAMHAVWREWAVEDGPLPKTHAIHHAAAANNLAEVRALLQQDVPLTLPDPMGTTPLMTAVKEDAWNVVKFLLARGADPNSFSPAGKPLLTLLVENDQDEILRQVLDLGTDPNVRHRETGWSALQAAAQAGKVEMMRVLLEAPGIEVDIQTEKYWSPLNVTISKGCLECVKLLLEHGADPRATVDGHGPPIVIAADYGQVEIARYLLDHGATANDRTPQSLWSPLNSSVDKDNAALFELFVERGADINAREEDGWTAMHMAALNGNVKMLRRLLELGGNINAATVSGRTVLHQAIKSDHPAVVALLLERGADARLQDQAGLDALAYAESLERTEITALLRRHAPQPAAA